MYFCNVLTFIFCLLQIEPFFVLLVWSLMIFMESWNVGKTCLNVFLYPFKKWILVIQKPRIQIMWTMKSRCPSMLKQAIMGYSPVPPIYEPHLVALATLWVNPFPPLSVNQKKEYTLSVNKILAYLQSVPDWILGFTKKKLERALNICNSQWF